MNKKITLSENQRRVLEFFQGKDRDSAYFFNYISEEIGLEKRLVRLACRALKRKWLLDYGVCADCDGMINGSGYHLTSFGESFKI